jgi:hypothetical protein
VLEVYDYVPDWPDAKAPTIVEVGANLAARMDSGGPVEKLMRQGRRVLLVRLRGMQESVSGPDSRRNNLPLGNDVSEAFLSLHIGRPLLGQRVLDLLTLLESLASAKESPTIRGFELVGYGTAGLAVLHAAALDERDVIRGIRLDRTLVSWSDVVQSGMSRQQLASAVPGVLQFYDLPELAARLEPSRLEIRAAVDAMGQQVSQAELESAYAPCKRSYGISDALLLQATP